MNKFRNVYSAKNQAKPSKELIQTTINLMNQETLQDGGFGII
jgi:hypothetical protein